MKKLAAIFYPLIYSVVAFPQVETELAIRSAPGGRSDYHYTEVFQTRGRWVIPDAGYIDFAAGNLYREIFAGGGAILINSKKLTIIEEGYLDQPSGPNAKGALYFQPWTYVGYRFTKKVSSEVVYFPYFPLNDAGRLQHVLERAKVEYLFKRFKIGAGYGAYQYGDEGWQNKPFITWTLKVGRFGDLELWAQRLPGNHIQPQIRYSKTFK